MLVGAERAFRLAKHNSVLPGPRLQKINRRCACSSMQPNARPTPCTPCYSICRSRITFSIYPPTLRRERIHLTTNVVNRRLGGALTPHFQTASFNSWNHSSQGSVTQPWSRPTLHNCGTVIASDRHPQAAGFVHSSGLWLGATLTQTCRPKHRQD